MVDAVKPLNTNDVVVVELAVIQVVAVEVLYCTVYDVAPETAAQERVAPELVIEDVVREVGVLQDVEVPVVKKVDEVEYTEQSVLTCHSYCVPTASEFKTIEVEEVVPAAIHEVDPIARY